MMTTTVFRVGLLFGAIVLGGCAGCDADAKAGDPWTLGDDVAVDVGADLKSDEPDITAADLGQPDVGDVFDVGAADVGPDAGPETITTVGWFTGAFEHSGFVDDPAGALTLGDRPCSPYLESTGVEQWWVAGRMDANPFIDAADGMGGRVRVTGVLSDVGEHGHLGNYERELVVTDAVRLPCETAALGGHCLRPNRGDSCVVPAINDPDASQKYELIVTYGGVSASADFELRITFAEEVGDGRTDAVVRWSLGDTFVQFAEADELGSLQLVQEQHGIFYNEIEYGDLSGWVMYSDGDSDSWYISISGESPNGDMHVWGAFDVTETIALP